MRAVVAAIRRGDIAATPVLVVSNQAQSGAIQFASEQGIATAYIPTKADESGADRLACQRLTDAGAELILLSGYLRKVGPSTLAAFNGRILNVHPALLPKFGGQGMYGRKVHEAVIAAAETQSGATIHLVDPEFDQGRVIGQRSVAVGPGDTVASLEERVQLAEVELVLETVTAIAGGALLLPL